MYIEKVVDVSDLNDTSSWFTRQVRWRIDDQYKGIKDENNFTVQE